MIDFFVTADGEISEVGFDDFQKGVMRGFDWALEALEGLKADYTDTDDIGVEDDELDYEAVPDGRVIEIIDDCIDMIEAAQCEMAASYQDECYDEDAPEAQGDHLASEDLYQNTIGWMERQKGGGAV